MLALFLFAPMFVFAATLGSGDEYSLGKSEMVSDNLYVGSGNVAVTGIVTGDLLVGGGNILVSGAVEKDVLLAGGNINLTGEVRDDARLIGGQIIIGNNVAGDLVAAGGTVQLLPDATVGKDVLLAGGRVISDGAVEGNLQIAGGEIVINGKVMGDVLIFGSQSVVIGKNAVIDGNLKYNSPAKANVADGAVIKGKIEFRELPAREREIKSALAGFLGFVGIVKLLSAVVLVSLLVIFFKSQMTGLSRNAMDNFGKELTRGLVLFIVTPVVSVILFATFLGAAVGGVLLLSYILLVVLAMFVDAIILGSWIAKVLLKKQEIEVSWLNASLGVFLLAIVSFIPILGWLFAFVFFLVALGTLSNAFYAKLRG